MVTKIIRLSLLTLATVGLIACQKNPQNKLDATTDSVVNDKKVELIADFEDGQVPAFMKASNVDLSITNTHDERSDKALNVHYRSKDNFYASYIISPDKPFDWSGLGEFSVVFDITNPSDLSVQLFANVSDADGKAMTRSIIVPAQSSNSYFIELKGKGLNVDSGLRSAPSSRRFNGKEFVWMWGEPQLNISAISKISLGVGSLLHDRSIQIDNIRAEPSPEYAPEFLIDIVDKFGQSAKVEFAEKIKSEEQLRAESKAELSALQEGTLAGRSKFGGWLEGPKLDATGYFRTAKHAGKWWLVDPEGHLFFSNGIANVRMSNMSTMTGVDFDQRLVVQRSPDDITPEDSIGLNPVSTDAQKTAYVSSDIRRNMFTWLPDYKDALANHYGYRRSVHTGPIERGETFSFYRANLERKYGETSPESFLNDWREVTVKRMLNWGFTSFGNWIDPSFYQMDKIPYFANGWILGNFKTVSSGSDFWSPLPDPFDPVFVERAKITVGVIADEVKNNPWCVGVFIDNEKSWGRMGSLQGQYGIAIHTLSRDAKDSPTKAHFVSMMKDKYKTIDKLNAQWKQSLASWDEFASGVTLAKANTDLPVTDLSELLQAYAEEYFKVVKEAVAEFMPNHLYMGARFADWGMTPEIVAAAAKHADVVSYNYYKEGFQKPYWSFLKDVNMPSIIGEFHNGATDTGLFHPGLVHASDQKDRGRMYQEYIDSVLDNPYFVGAHWFQYIDSPITGRAYDGENYNVGFVTVTDTPYKELVEGAKAVNSRLYETRMSNKGIEE